MSDLELRPYQHEGIDFLVENKRVLLADEQGTGKTPQAIFALQRAEVPEALIVCPRVVLGNWERRLWEWSGITPIVFAGNPGARSLAWEAFQDAPRPKVLITNYAQLPNVFERQYFWHAVIFDEAHALKNRNTKTFKIARKFRSTYLWLLTGTPMSKGPQDLWSYLHLIDKNAWPAFWPYVHKYLYVHKTPWGMEIKGAREPAKLKLALAPYMKRRIKKDVMQWLPDKVRDAIDAELTPEQTALYNKIADDGIAYYDDGSMVIVGNPLEMRVALRKICITPALLGGTNDSGSLKAAKEFLDNLMAPCVIFVPWTQPFPFIEEYLTSRIKSLEVFKIQGKMKWDELEAERKRFEKSTNPRRILLCSASLGVGFDIESATHALFIGADWSPTVNQQAEDRLRKGANIYYIRNKGTVEEDVLDVVAEKKSWGDQVTQPAFYILGGKK